MSAGLIIKTRLAEVSGVTDFVGASPNDRISPVVLEQDSTLPAITYRHTGDGTRASGQHSDHGAVSVSVAVIALAKTYDEARALAKQVDLALNRHGTAVTGTPIAGFTVYDIKCRLPADTYVPELSCFGVSIEVTVDYLQE